jgi:WD40 repeat protein
VQSWTVETVSHRGRVNAAAYSPDGRWLATAGLDGTVRLWDATGRVHALLGHADPVRALSWSPDPRRPRLASSGREAAVLVWDPETCRLLQTLEGHPAPVTALGWLDGKTLAALGGQAIHVWDADAGKPAGPVRPGPPHRPDLPPAFAPDGKTLAAAQVDHTVRLWDIESGKLRRTLAGHKDRIGSLAWSPDSGAVAAGSRDGTVRLWDAATGAPRPHVLETKQANGVTALAWSPNGRTLAGGGVGPVQWWDTDTGKPLRTVRKPQTVTSALTWSPDGRTLAGAGLTGGVWLWQGGQPEPARTFPGCDQGPPVPGLAWSPDGRTLGFGRQDGTLFRWDLAAGQFQGVFGEPDKAARQPNFAWSPDGRRLAVQVGGSVKVYDTASGQLLYNLPGQATEVAHLSWSPDCKIVTASGAGDDPTTRLYDAESGQLLHTLPTAAALAWSPDGRTVATGGKRVDLWDPRSGNRLRALTGSAPRYGVVVWAPDGRTLAAAGDDHAIHLWDTASWQPGKSLTGHTGEVIDLCWRPDGMLVSLGRDGSTRVWDVRAGKEDRAFTGFPPHGKLSPDGRALAAPLSPYPFGGTAVRLWELEQGRPTGTVLVLRPRAPALWLAVAADGRYRASAGIDRHAIVVVQTEAGQETLTPDEFAARFRQKNEPDRFRLLGHTSGPGPQQ